MTPMRPKPEKPLLDDVAEIRRIDRSNMLQFSIEVAKTLPRSDKNRTEKPN